MDNCHCRPVSCATALMSLIGAVLVVAFVWHYPDDAKDWPNWASALGTTIAAAVALWFGLADVRLRRSERARASNIYQWLFVPDIGQAMPAVNSLIDFIKRLEREESGFEINEAELDYLDLLCSTIQMPTINAHIAALVQFPPSLGKLLARIASNGTVVAYRMRVVRSRPRVTDQLKVYVGKQRQLLEELRSDIDQTIGALG